MFFHLRFAPRLILKRLSPVPVSSQGGVDRRLARIVMLTPDGMPCGDVLIRGTC
jgi:hypothetical protein